MFLTQPDLQIFSLYLYYLTRPYLDRRGATDPFGQATCRSASGITTWQEVLSIVKCGLE